MLGSMYTALIGSNVSSVVCRAGSYTQLGSCFYYICMHLTKPQVTVGLAHQLLATRTSRGQTSGSSAGHSLL